MVVYELIPTDGVATLCQTFHHAKRYHIIVTILPSFTHPINRKHEFSTRKSRNRSIYSMVTGTCLLQLGAPQFELTSRTVSTYPSSRYEKRTRSPSFSSSCSISTWHYWRRTPDRCSALVYRTAKIVPSPLKTDYKTTFR